MAVTITPGDLYIVTNVLAPTPAQIVGGSDQWADDSDASYGEATNTFIGGPDGTQGERLAAPLTYAGSGAVTALDVIVRVMLTTDDTTPPETVGIEIRDSSDVELVFMRWDVPSVDVIYDIGTPAMIYPLGKSLTTLTAGIAAGGAYAQTVGNPPETVTRFRAMTIYELDFIVTTTRTKAPLCQIYPQGRSTSATIWPPSGSQQSGRPGGYY